MDDGCHSLHSKSGKPAYAQIMGGKVSLPSGRGPSPVSHRVEITWKKKAARKSPCQEVPDKKMDETFGPSTGIQYGLPLVAEVKSSGNVFDF